MRFLIPGILSLYLSVSALAQNIDTRLVRETEPLSPKEELAKLKVPEGFEIQLFASEPMINKPINLAFDGRGRLWVSSTVEYPYAAERERWVDDEGTKVRDSRDAIRILEDTDGDGQADKVTVFADGLNIPTGVLPWHRPEHADGCIAWSIPNIWYFADTDGDGKCDQREILFGPLGYEDDTHGMCSSFRLGSDGWVYGTHGFNNTSHFRVREENLQGAQPGDPGTSLDLNSGNVYRFRPDGSRIEIWSWGQVNPFGLAFDLRGNLYSADCHSAPVYQLLRGAHYPSFGKPHDGLGFGPVMIEHTHGSTGICGIAFIDRDLWGESWNDHVFVGNVVTSRVNHDRIEWRGSTPVAIEQPDFVVSDDPWFRPVDLRIGPDGALYVADFYNRIIGHYEVPLEHPGRDRERGRIWRISRTEGEVNPPPKIAFPKVPPSPDLAFSLGSESAWQRRGAAEILYDQPDLEFLPGLAKALAEVEAKDTHLRHALRLTIREHLKLPGAFESFSELSKTYPDMAGIPLAVPTSEAAEFLLGELESGGFPGEVERDEVPTHLGQFAQEELNGRVLDWINKSEAASSIGRALALRSWHEGRLERDGVATPPEVAAFAISLAGKLLDEVEEAGQIAWTETFHPQFANAWESPWTVQLRPCADGVEETVLSSLRKGERGAEQRTGILRSRSFSAPEKLEFWICGHRGNPKEEAHSKNLVRLVSAGGQEDVIETAYPPRSDEAQKVEWDLTKKVGTEVCLEIVDGDAGKSYAWLGITRIEPADLGISVDRFAEGARTNEALKFLAGMLSHLAPVELRDRLANWAPPAPVAAPIPVSPERRKELDRLIAERGADYGREKGVGEKGRELFQVHCAVCHRIGGNGGLIGPQLDGIGNRGVERLCEDILDPNRNVDAHFHLRSLSLEDGSLVSGFVISETSRSLRLLDAAGQEHRIPKDQVTETQVSPMSLMPPNFGEVLSESDFRNLLSYLLEK